MKYFIGIDPGISGGLVSIDEDNEVILEPMPNSEKGVWLWLAHRVSVSPEGHQTVFVVIEHIVPGFGGTGKSSMAKLYGSYRMLRAFLIALGLKFEPVTATDWHRYLGIVPKSSNESKTAFKNRLKKIARLLYPRYKKKITLKTADALLLAVYCKKYFGKSK